jgi:N-acyl-D-aspartate/D-glutamate deacylase
MGWATIEIRNVSSLISYILYVQSTHGIPYRSNLLFDLHNLMAEKSHMKFDLKIQGGLVIDGTGAEAQSADVAIRDGQIVEVGECAGPASDVIDAKGMLVTPGFVDIHTHYDGQISWDDELSPTCYHGVTTAVMGSCGVGFAPVREADHQRLIDLMQGVEDIPGTALAEGLTWDWETFPEYMNAIDSRPHAIDFAAQVPHDAVRVYVMQDRAIAGENATAEDIDKMRSLVRKGLEAGAVGFSTGRTDNHRASDGSATPASEATERELVGIASAFQGLNHGVLQAVSDFKMGTSPDLFHPEFDLLEAMAVASEHPFSVSLLQRPHAPEQWQWIIKRIEEANERGLPIRFQAAARGIGVLLGLQATFHPFMGFPSYKAISHLPLSDQVAAMRQPSFKERLLSEKTDKVSGDGTPIPPIADLFLANLDYVASYLYGLDDTFNYEPNAKDSIMAAAQARGCSPLELIYDALLEDEGRALLYFPIYNYLKQNLDDVHTMLTHPLALPGLSDGGAHVGTVCDASFPTYLLSHWTRDRKGSRIPLEKMIQNMTSTNARFMGFHDRGTLAPGMKADVNVIDYENLRIDHPQMFSDLPAGGHRFMQRAAGYKATIVSGHRVICDDELTDSRPGRLVRLFD